MKKLIALLCVTMLCASCLALSACGGSAPASSSGSSAAAEPAPDPAANFIGDWKLAGGETKGVTVYGDFGSLLGIDTGIQLSIKEGGTGVTSFGKNTSDFTWEMTGDNAITLTVAKTETASSESSASADAGASAESAAATNPLAGNGNAPVKFTLADGMLKGATQNEGQDITLIFTTDGVLPGAPEISMKSATPITSEADLVGKYELTGMNMMGMSAYGDSESIAAMSNGTDASLEFKEGGTCVMGTDEMTYTVGSDGTTISDGQFEIPVLALGEGVVMDVGTATGLGAELVIMYTK